jgi:hypothetical protein
MSFCAVVERRLPGGLLTQALIFFAYFLLLRKESMSPKAKVKKPEWLFGATGLPPSFLLFLSVNINFIL